MNILVLGNGFDLAHGLPTDYPSFLQFLDNYINYKNYVEMGTEQPPINNEAFFTYFKTLFDNRKENQNIINELSELLTQNGWVNYFKAIQTKDGWIDFEKEIANVIKIMDEIRASSIAESKKPKSVILLPEYQQQILKPFVGNRGTVPNLQTLEIIKNQMLKDLNNLIRCLEIYLDDFIKNSTIQNRIKCIEDLDINKVLSFNYTQTYKTLYDKSSNSIEYDYIHGKADINHKVDDCNMIIGIDEYLTGPEKDTDNYFIEFKKFFQRIYKMTGNEYKNWLTTHKEYILEDGKMYPKINIYIYGHSLDVTDKDILAELIKTCGAKTTIFYHTKEAYRKQISNLVKVLGQDELISRTGGLNKTIVFKNSIPEEF